MKLDNWAVEHFTHHNHKYHKAHEYYEGEHLGVFRNYEVRKIIGLLAEIFENYCDNLCPTVVNTLADRLQIGGFSCDDTTAQTIITDSWKYNKMAAKSGLIHTNTLIYGDEYVIVWYDKKGNPRIYVQDPKEIAVLKDEDDDIIEAVKVWQDYNDFMRLTIYKPDQIERYISKQTKKQQPEPDFVPYDQDGNYIIANPHNQVPVFHFQNILGECAKSEISKTVISLQDTLNWAVVYMYIAAVNDVLPLKVLFGVETQYDEEGNIIPIKAGAGQLLQVPNTDASITQLQGADLTQFLSIQDNTRQEIARVTQTPLHAFLLNSGDYPSGSALRVAEAGLMSKVKDRQILFGDAWENCMKFVCKLSGIQDADIVCNWNDTQANNDKEESEVMLNKQALGVDEETLWHEMGYDSAQIEQIKENKLSNPDVNPDTIPMNMPTEMPIDNMNK